MNIKKAAISKITLNSATFSHEIIKPNFINFFYGLNGTGKSTIAQIIASKQGLTFEPGKSAEGVRIHVFDRSFISANFASPSNLRGVFTIGEQNLEAQNKISQKTAKKAEVEHKYSHCISSKTSKETVKRNLWRDFQETCWVKTKSIRDGCSQSIKGCKTKARFAERILETHQQQAHDLHELEMLYDTAFDPSSRLYNVFQKTGVAVRLKGSPGNKLLAKSIVTSGSSSYSEFIKDLGAADWLQQGHRNFNKNAGSHCPYCSQTLPPDFEEQITKCFDVKYQDDIRALEQFLSDYEGDMQDFIKVFSSNLINPYPKLDLSEYKTKLDLMQKAIEINIGRIKDKLREPSRIVTLENVKTLRDEINSIIEEFNEMILMNNAIVADKKTKQSECTNRVWEYARFLLQKEITNFFQQQSIISDDITTLNNEIATLTETSNMLAAEIVDLNRQISSSQPAMSFINNMLRDSGFQGFTLRERPDEKDTYEVIRADGRVAEHLSDGERGFVAFLYFYYLVQGCDPRGGGLGDKIVVIDDPVSGMDDIACQIVSKLVQKLARNCNKSVIGQDIDDEGFLCEISQIFVLTHNAGFHKENAACNELHRSFVSVFEVSKANNKSAVRLRG